MGQTSKADVYMRHVVPRQYWSEGATRQIRRMTNDGDDTTNVFGTLVVAAVFAVIGALGSLALEIVWHPLFYVLPAAATVAGAWLAGYGAYEHAADIDGEILSRAEADVWFAIQGEKDGILKEKPLRMRCEAVLGDRRTSATQARREMVIRLAAIKAEVDDGESVETGRSAAEAVITRAEGLATRGDAVADAKVKGRPSAKGGKGRMAEIAGMATITEDPAIDALIRLGEQALANEPELTDATGARVDALITRHLPTLTAAYRNALRNADPAERSRAETEYRRGLELARESLAEALDASQNRHADKLAEQVRFLDMRRSA